MKKERIDEIFENADDSTDALIALYKEAIPEFDNVKKLHGWPEAGEKLCHYCCAKMIELDEKNNAKHMKGGYWLNNGFSRNTELGDWEVKVNPSIIELEE